MGHAEKVKAAASLIEAAGLKVQIAPRTDGSYKLKLTIQGKPVEFEFSENSITSSKYAYLLPDGLFMTIEAL